MTQTIYAMTRERAFARDIGLSGQIQRAAVSVMANIAEDFERNRPGKFHQSLSVAKGSCAELRSHLYAAHDAGYLDKKGFTEALAQAEEVGRIIDALRTAVAAQRKPLSMRHEPVQPTQDSGLSTQH